MGLSFFKPVKLAPQILAHRLEITKKYYKLLTKEEIDFLVQAGISDNLLNKLNGSYYVDLHGMNVFIHSKDKNWKETENALKAYHNKNIHEGEFGKIIESLKILIKRNADPIKTFEIDEHGKKIKKIAYQLKNHKTFHDVEKEFKNSFPLLQKFNSSLLSAKKPSNLETQLRSELDQHEKERDMANKGKNLLQDIIFSLRENPQSNIEDLFARGTEEDKKIIENFIHNLIKKSLPTDAALVLLRQRVMELGKKYNLKEYDINQVEELLRKEIKTRTHLVECIEEIFNGNGPDIKKMAESADHYLAATDTVRHFSKFVLS